MRGTVHMQVITIGIDLAKQVFHVHGVDANDKVVFNKPLRRSQVLTFFAKLAPCLIGMEACASAHYWARELKKLGHDVRLMPAKDVKAYVKRNKNDAVDAAGVLRGGPATDGAYRAGEDAPAASPAHAAPRARPTCAAAYTGHQWAALAPGRARHRCRARL